MRLIDADDFKQYIQDAFGDFVGLFRTEEGAKHAADVTFAFLQDIDEQPTIDAVVVVRCKDCKHHEDEHRGEKRSGFVYCPNITCGWIEDDCYCKDGSRGEKK